MTLNSYQREIAILGPCFALRFLVRPDERANARSQMEGFSDGAIFHRWMGLTWTLDEPEAVAILSDDERSALDGFNEVFRSLPWKPIETHPFVCEVPEEELTKLVPSARILLQLLENRLPVSQTQPRFSCRNILWDWVWHIVTVVVASNPRSRV